MKQPRILVACEESQAVTIEFRKLGAEAFSCDILPCSGGHPEWHIQGNVIPLLYEEWDAIIAFPPCTHLCSSGARYWRDKQKNGKQETAIEFFKNIYNSNTKRIACENPSGILSTKWRKPDQYIHPFQFGDPYKKRTGLWLKLLPALKPTNIVNPTASWHSGSTRGGKKKDGTRTKNILPTASKRSSRDRSKTFPGIARAMAEQWYPIILKDANETQTQA